MNKYYKLLLDDYSTPSFVSFPKYYFGTLKQLEEFFTAMKQSKTIAERHSQIIEVFDRYINGEVNITHNVAYDEVPFLTPAEILGIKQSAVTGYSWEHLNTWDCIYKMKCDKAESTHIWVSCNGRYFRCIQTRFINLKRKRLKGDYVLVERFWGYPKLIELIELGDSNWQLWNRLFEIEKIFDTEIEWKNDCQSFTPDNADFDFTEILNDIFGDG